ncbi:MAG: NUDIX hydrolase, partial [Pseudomonadota bacterium]
MRRFGPAAVHSVRYRRRPGAYAILARGSEVLVTYQGGIHHEFQLPGGGIDPGEGPIQALHREVLEETGWHISKPKFWRRFRRFGYMPEYDLWAEKICHIYYARPVLQLGPPTLGFKLFNSLSQLRIRYQNTVTIRVDVSSVIDACSFNNQ